MVSKEGSKGSCVLIVLFWLRPLKLGSSREIFRGHRITQWKPRSREEVGKGNGNSPPESEREGSDIFGTRKVGSGSETRKEKERPSEEIPSRNETSDVRHLSPDTTHTILPTRIFYPHFSGLCTLESDTVIPE